jgi:phosphopantothenate-cysteine ligase
MEEKMSKLNVVITSAGTREYLDNVRVLTNISTGKLGAKIANVFLSHGHNVTYVAPSTAVKPEGDYSNVVVTDTNSVMEAMKTLVPKADVVIQSMAVSDFTFNLDKAIKVSGESAEDFVEHIRKTITKTPKVISNFRKWNPNAVLVGFKFTVGKNQEELTKIATKLMEDNKLDMVFANDKAQMQKAGEHVGFLIMKDWS